MAVQGWHGASSCYKILLRCFYSPIHTCVPSPRDRGSPFPLVPLTLFPFKVALFPYLHKNIGKSLGRILVACDVNPNPFKDQSLRNIHFLSESTPAGVSLRPQTALTHPPTPVLSYLNVRNTDRGGLTLLP